MFKKLDKMLERFEKLNQLVSDSEVIAKIDEWRAYTKELSEITETVEKYTEYKKVISEQEEIITAEGFEAIVLQHEYDHLDGILFYDRIDPFNPNQPKPNEVLL